LGTQATYSPFATAGDVSHFLFTGLRSYLGGGDFSGLSLASLTFFSSASQIGETF